MIKYYKTKSDSDFDFIAQGDENDGELDSDAELSLFESSPLGSQLTVNSK